MAYEPHGRMRNPEDLDRQEEVQTKYRGSNDSEYEIYLACADDGKGGKPLKTYREWLDSQDSK